VIKWIESKNEECYALLRIVAGFLLFWHGSANLFEFPIANPHDPPYWVLISAGVINVVGGALVVIGLYVRQTAFICCGFLAFAYWLAHGYKAVLPYVNGGELAAILCFVFLYITANGAGIWSLDQRRA